MSSTKAVVLLMTLLLLPLTAGAENCGLSRVDHIVSQDASGVWNPNLYRGIVIGLTVGEIGGAVWEGAESRFGKTM